MATEIRQTPVSWPDDDDPEWTSGDFKRARPASGFLPGLIGERATQELLRNEGGRPVNADKKVSQTLWLDPDVLAAYKQEGSGWQTRINQVLRDHLPGSPE